MLLDENPLIELNDDDGTNLIRLLFASVRKAVGERIVPASNNRKQYYNKAQKVCYLLFSPFFLFNPNEVCEILVVQFTFRQFLSLKKEKVCRQKCMCGCWKKYLNSV